MIKKVLSKKRINMIKKWLNVEQKKTVCPFDSDFTKIFSEQKRDEYCKNVCGSLFPRLPIYNPDCIFPIECPCYCTSVKYITRRAKEFIKTDYKK